MQLQAKDLLHQRLAALNRQRQRLAHQPGLALIWVGDDQQTATYIDKKRALAKKLDCQFFLHHFPSASQNQLESVIAGLNQRQDVDGIVIQLPLPENLDTDRLIASIRQEKDIDNLSGESPYDSPTPSSILALLECHHIDPSHQRNVILGAGKLVGSPLAKVFQRQNWPLDIVARQARAHADMIRTHDLLIAATGVKGLVTANMVHKDMVVVDGSGLDVADVAAFEPLVKAITPQTGAIGPLTVSFLFENLLVAAKQRR